MLPLYPPLLPSTQTSAEEQALIRMAISRRFAPGAGHAEKVFDIRSLISAASMLALLPSEPDHSPQVVSEAEVEHDLHLLDQMLHADGYRYQYLQCISYMPGLLW